MPNEGTRRAVSALGTGETTNERSHETTRSDAGRRRRRPLSLRLERRDRAQPDGTASLEQLPLTREDALHPEPGDYIVHSDPHADDIVYFKSVFKALLKHDPSAAVLADCGVDWGLRGIKHVCPDITVLFNVDMKKWPRTEAIFYVKALHARTALVIEVTSRSTRSNDVETKVGYYHRCRVPIYIIVDAMIEERGQRKLKLIGYRYAPAGYEPITPNEHGRIWLDAVGAWLGIVHDAHTGIDRVACFDATSQAEIGDYTAITQAYAREVEAHARSKKRAAQAEADAAEARTKATKAEAKAAKAEAKAAKAEAKAKADAEARALAETRIRELEALVKRPPSATARPARPPREDPARLAARQLPSRPSIAVACRARRLGRESDSSTKTTTRAVGSGYNRRPRESAPASPPRTSRNPRSFRGTTGRVSSSPPRPAAD